jgi:hypothetical protein
MAGVFAQMGWPLQRRPRIERQVFATTPTEVEEMIRLRLAEEEGF